MYHYYHFLQSKAMVSATFFLVVFLTILHFVKSTSLRLDHSLTSSFSKETIAWKPKCEIKLDLLTSDVQSIKLLEHSVLESKDPDNEFLYLRLMQQSQPIFERKYPAIWFGNSNETLNIHVDENLNIVSFDLVLPSTQLRNLKPRTLSTLHLYVNVIKPISLPTPVFTKRIKVAKKPSSTHPSTSDSQDEHEMTIEAPPPEEEKSFIKKYWIYIVLFLVFLMLAGREEPASAENNTNTRSESQS